MNEDEYKLAFANVGLDYDAMTPVQRVKVIKAAECCGSCACIFYTGMTIYEHTCERRHAPRVTVVVSR